MNKNNIHILSRGVIIDQDHILLAYDPRPHPNHYVDPQYIYDQTPFLASLTPNFFKIKISEMSVENAACAIIDHGSKLAS